NENHIGIARDVRRRGLPGSNLFPMGPHGTGSFGKVLRSFSLLASNVEMLIRNCDRASLAIVLTSANDLPTPTANAIRFRSFDRWHVTTLYFPFVSLRKASRYQLPSKSGCRFRNRGPKLLSTIFRDGTY